MVSSLGSLRKCSPIAEPSKEPLEHCALEATLESKTSAYTPKYKQSLLAILAPPPTFTFKPTVWLGAKHDELPLISFREYTRRLNRTQPEAYAAQFQALFTFGFLEGVMEVKVPESILLNADKSMMVDSHLPSLLQTWRNRIRALGKGNASQEWAKRVAETIKVAHGILQLEIFHPSFSPLLRCSIPRDSIFHILSTIACIAEAIRSSWVAFPDEVRPKGSGVDWSFLRDVTSKQQQKIVSNGWCPLVVRLISGSCAFQYASTRPPARGDVQYVHDACTSQSCVVNNVDTNTYQNRHAPGARCERCTYVTPPLGRVVGLLESGQVPVVRVHHDSGDDRAIPAVIPTSFSTTPYVAISHVWSDGLGSTTEVGLPSCQILRLARLVSQVAPNGHFWIDSLCVPARRDMRKRAIQLMAETYRRADMVLVIDSGIRTCSIHAPLEEKLLRVITSGWMQRLWTLQEAMLAAKLCFEFSDGIIGVDDIIPTGEGLFNPLYMQLSTEVYRLRSYQSFPKEFGIAQVARALKWRSTSKAEDETLAICGLLHVDASELVDLQREERMKKLLILVGAVPGNTPFIASPKLRLDNFRWAPRTLMTKTDTSLAVGYPGEIASGRCTPSGLASVYYAVCFDNTVVKRDVPEWAVCDRKNGLFLKVTAVPMMTYDDTVDEYECDGLLFVDRPESGQATTAIAASVTIMQDDAAENWFRARYQMRLFAVRIGELELKKIMGPVVQARLSGRMQVVMV